MTLLKVDTESSAQLSRCCTPGNLPSLSMHDADQGRTWGVTSGVGATALWIAHIRYLEKFQAAPKFKDPFAERWSFDGKDKEVFDQMAASLHHFMFMDENERDFHKSLTTKYVIPQFGRKHVVKYRNAPPEESRQGKPNPLQNGVRLRTAYFDREIMRVLGDRSLDVNQFVTLASGCDCRCLRLECAKDVQTWLIDQPAMIDTYKANLPELESRPDIHTIGVKFGEENWWDKLLSSGFDPTRPSFFLVEGLVMYLQQEEVEDLFLQIAKLMAPGSTVAGDYINKGFIDHPMLEPFNEQLRRFNAPWTYGVKNSNYWARMLQQRGLYVKNDLPSVDMNSKRTKMKMGFIDTIATHIPMYRSYWASN